MITFLLKGKSIEYSKNRNIYFASSTIIQKLNHTFVPFTPNHKCTILICKMTSQHLLSIASRTIVTNQLETHHRNRGSQHLSSTTGENIKNPCHNRRHPRISARTRVLVSTVSSPVIPQDKGLRRVVDGLINFERESWPRVRNPDTPRTEEGRRGKRN